MLLRARILCGRRMFSQSAVALKYHSKSNNMGEQMEKSIGGKVNKRLPPLFDLKTAVKLDTEASSQSNPDDDLLYGETRGFKEGQMVKRHVVVWKDGVHNLTKFEYSWGLHEVPAELNWRLQAGKWKAICKDYHDDPETNTPKALSLKYGVSLNIVVGCIKLNFYATSPVIEQTYVDAVPLALRKRVVESTEWLNDFNSKVRYSSQDPRFPMSVVEEPNPFLGPEEDPYSPGQPLMISLGERAPAFRILNEKEMEKFNEELVKLEAPKATDKSAEECAAWCAKEPTAYSQPYRPKTIGPVRTLFVKFDKKGEKRMIKKRYEVKPPRKVTLSSYHHYFRKTVPLKEEERESVQKHYLSYKRNRLRF